MDKVLFFEASRLDRGTGVEKHRREIFKDLRSRRVCTPAVKKDKESARDRLLSRNAQKGAKRTNDHPNDAKIAVGAHSGEVE